MSPQIISGQLVMSTLRDKKCPTRSFERPLPATHHRAKCFTLRDFALAGL